MQTTKEDTFNVMVLSVVISVIVIIGSIVALWFLTNDAYLDSYFTLEAFFNVQNTAASEALATVAFAQNPTTLLQILVVVVIDNLSRILIVSFILAAVIDFLNYANVEGIINDIKSGALRKHIIICSYTEVSERLIKKLNAERAPYIVIEPNREKELELNEKKILNIAGEFTDASILKRAGVGRAQAIVFTSMSDMENVIGTLTVRKLNPTIKIISRLGDESIRKKAYGIGADMAVIPEHLAGIEIGEFIARNFGA